MWRNNSLARDVFVLCCCCLGCLFSSISPIFVSFHKTQFENSRFYSDRPRSISSYTAFKCALHCCLFCCWMTVLFCFVYLDATASKQASQWLLTVFVFLLIAIYVCVLWVMQRQDRIHVGGWRAARPLLLNGGGQVEKNWKGETLLTHSELRKKTRE